MRQKSVCPASITTWQTSAGKHLLDEAAPGLEREFGHYPASRTAVRAAITTIRRAGDNVAITAHLNNEFHARPPIARLGATLVSHLAFKQNATDVQAAHRGSAQIPHSGLPTFHEFMQRRLLPAMNTCAAISPRQGELCTRVASNSQLLRTRVDIELDRQNQELLAQMNKRAHLQLRLQETVEYRSVVVLTYYRLQLVQYPAKGTENLHHLSTDAVTAVSIPRVAALVFWSSRRHASEDDPVP